MSLNKFKFTTSHGETIEVPYMKDNLTMKQAKKIRKDYKDDSEALGEAMVAAAMDDKILEKVENLSINDYEKFMAGWTQSDGEDVSLGES